MQRKWEEKTRANLLDVILEATNLNPDQIDKKLLLEGAKERDIIYAGLEEVMSSATSEVIHTSREKKLDLRMAAYVNGITKIHEFYTLSGINGCE
jgi:glutamate dehydrogenase (NAD(P)+)